MVSTSSPSLQPISVPAPPPPPPLAHLRGSPARVNTPRVRAGVGAACPQYPPTTTAPALPGRRATAAALATRVAAAGQRLPREGGRSGRGGWRGRWRSRLTVATLNMDILTVDILTMAGGGGGVMAGLLRRYLLQAMLTTVAVVSDWLCLLWLYTLWPYLLWLCLVRARVRVR